MVRAQVLLTQALGIGQLLAVVGGSMGGMLALEWAARHAEKVFAVVAIATAAGHELIPGRQVAAVDATGAGDAFTGALLAELSRGAPLARAARFANAAAALSTLGYGAIAPLPRRAAVASALGPAD